MNLRFRTVQHREALIWVDLFLTRRTKSLLVSYLSAFFEEAYQYCKKPSPLNLKSSSSKWRLSLSALPIFFPPLHPAPTFVINCGVVLLLNGAGLEAFFSLTASWPLFRLWCAALSWWLCLPGDFGGGEACKARVEAEECERTVEEREWAIAVGLSFLWLDNGRFNSGFKGTARWTNCLWGGQVHFGVLLVWCRRSLLRCTFVVFLELMRHVLALKVWHLLLEKHEPDKLRTLCAWPRLDGDKCFVIESNESWDL